MELFFVVFFGMSFLVMGVAWLSFLRIKRWTSWRDRLFDVIMEIERDNPPPGHPDFWGIK